MSNLSRFEKLKLLGLQHGRDYHINATTADGRKFRYRIDEFLKHINVESRDDELVVLAERALGEKYKYCPACICATTWPLTWIDTRSP
jgi:hypothetical protein